MFCDHTSFGIKELRYLLLSEPDSFFFKPNFQCRNIVLRLVDDDVAFACGVIFPYLFLTAYPNNIKWVLQLLTLFLPLLIRSRYHIVTIIANETLYTFLLFPDPL